MSKFKYYLIYWKLSLCFLQNFIKEPHIVISNNSSRLDIALINSCMICDTLKDDSIKIIIIIVKWCSTSYSTENKLYIKLKS